MKIKINNFINRSGCKNILLGLFAFAFFNVFADDHSESVFDISLNCRGELNIYFANSQNASRHGAIKKIAFHFGMPSRPADRTWIEDGVVFLEWKENCIVYTMNLFCFPLEDGTTTKDKIAVVVRLHGENTADEYRDAKAGFAIIENKTRIPFDFAEGIASVKRGNEILNLCAIEIPAGCHVAKKTDGFEFSGNMPPGTTGFMVFKIPMKTGLDNAVMSRLVNIDYEDSLNTFKKTMKSAGIGEWKKNGDVYFFEFKK